MTSYVHPFPGNALLHVDNMNDYDDETRREVLDPADANVVSSEEAGRYGQFHRPVLDIDFEAKLEPSSTPGHYHLYLDKSMPWEDYELLLVTLAKVGIIEPGYANVSIERRHTAVRLPWIKKTPSNEE